MNRENTPGNGNLRVAYANTVGMLVAAKTLDLMWNFDFGDHPLLNATEIYTKVCGSFYSGLFAAVAGVWLYDRSQQPHNPHPES